MLLETSSTNHINCTIWMVAMATGWLKKIISSETMWLIMLFFYRKDISTSRYRINVFNGNCSCSLVGFKRLVTRKVKIGNFCYRIAGIYVDCFFFCCFFRKLFFELSSMIHMNNYYQDFINDKLKKR